MSKADSHIKEAYSRGYRAVDGQIYNPAGTKLSLRKDPNGYIDFGYYGRGVGKVRLRVHRLVAYQKYGAKMFKKGIECRHLDSNTENNTDINIEIGTHIENMSDKLRATATGRCSHGDLQNRRIRLSKDTLLGVWSQGRSLLHNVFYRRRRAQQVRSSM